MKYIAKENFAGKVSMCVGEVMEIADDIATSLVNAGYIEEVGKAEKKEPAEPAKKKEKKA